MRAVVALLKTRYGGVRVDFGHETLKHLARPSSTNSVAPSAIMLRTVCVQRTGAVS